MAKPQNINEQIRHPQVRLLDEQGQLLGLMPAFKALELAYARNLDLVEIASDATPPVCKIMDYRKHLYAQAKQDKENRRHQTKVDLSEIRFRPHIGEHDVAIKVKHIRELLQENNRVKVSVIFRGREMQHRELGIELLKGVVKSLEDASTLASPPSLLGSSLSAVLAPKG